MNNVMLDLETLGTGTDAAILSIGAVMFDEYGTGAEFYATIDAQSAVDSGGTITVATVAWWAQQGAKARELFAGKNPDISNVLIRFTDWCAKQADTRSLVVWANAPTFDCVILRSAYQRENFRTPWMFYNERCFRTMKNLYDVPHKFTGTAHNAVDDARSQALHLIKILNTASINLL